MATQRNTLTDRFISADGPHLIKEHDSSEDAKDDSFKHQQRQHDN